MEEREDRGERGWRRRGRTEEEREDGGERGQRRERAEEREGRGEGGQKRRAKMEEEREEGGEGSRYSLNHQCFAGQGWGAGPQQKAQEIRKVGSLLPKWLGGNLIKVRERKRREHQRLK